MERVLETITSVNSAINSVVWGPVMLILLVGTGAYLTIRTAQEAARQIWPGRRWFTGQEMEFTCTCRELIDQGEAEIARRLSVLALLREGTETDLVGTLSTYYLDAASSIPDTAAHLFMHKNTVKYRLQQAERRLGHPVDKLPEAIALYKACALNRLLSS